MREKTRSGVWLSLVERLVRDQEAAGSNPVTPTINHSLRLARGALCWRKSASRTSRNDGVERRRAPFPRLLSSPAPPRSGALKSNGGRPTRGVSFFFGKKCKSNLIFRSETIIMIVRPSCEGVGGRHGVCIDPDGRIDRAEARRLFGVFNQNNGVPDTAYLCRVKGRLFCITNRKKEKTEWKANKRKRAVL